MKALVVHDEQGRIIAMTFPSEESGLGVGLELAEGETLLEVEDVPEHIRESHLTVHEDYRVDVENKTLVRRS